MSRDPRWRQPTPIMQLRAVLASLDGNKQVHIEGIIIDVQYMRRVDEHIEQLMNLLPFVEKGNWQEGGNFLI